MKLLHKADVDLKAKKQSDELVEKNARLLGYFTKGIKRLNSLKDNYDQEKANKLRAFEDFCNQLNLKKNTLLEEYTKWEKAVEDKKEAYYSLVTKQDELDEREYLIKRKEENLSLRENFTKESEEKLKVKWDQLLKP